MNYLLSSLLVIGLILSISLPGSRAFIYSDAYSSVQMLTSKRPVFFLRVGSDELDQAAHGFQNDDEEDGEEYFGHFQMNHPDGHDDMIAEHLEEIPNDIDDDISSELQDDESKQQSTVSRSKWKKKRYLMISDVASCIKSRDPNAVRKAEELVRRMHRLYARAEHIGTENREDFRPTVQAYNLWINAIAKSNQPDAGASAEAVLREMQQDDVAAEPNVVSYTSVMDAYAKESCKENPLAAADAERILFELIQMTEYNTKMKISVVTCDTAINAWAKQGTWEGARRAQQILDRLADLASTNAANSDLRPTAHTFATVIHGWASCGDSEEGPSRAEAILNRMLHAKEKDAVRPDTVIFNAVIHAWAASGNPQAGSKAVGLLRQMRTLHTEEGYNCAPDTVTYNTVLSAWSHCGHVNAAMQSEKILQEMVLNYREDPDHAPAPNTVSYNSVLHAWSKSGLDNAAGRAEKVLDYMIRSQQEDIAPDVYSFGSVLDALAKSKEPNKAVRARHLLDELLKLYEETRKESLKPSHIPFNTVLNAAAFSALGTSEQEQRDALQVAVRTFTLMKDKGIAPDQVTYGNLLKSFANLMPAGDARVNMALKVFEQCCENGLVGQLVWNEIRRAVPTKILSNRLELRASASSLEIRDLPRSWRKRVRDKRSSKATQHERSERKETRNRRKSQKRNKQHNDEESTRPRRMRYIPAISEPSFQSGRDL